MRGPLIKALLMATLGIASANALANSCSGPIDVQTTTPKARPEFRPESWTPRPTHVLPDSDPRTLTGLVNRYVGLQ
jgi:hypothetical protein